MLAREGNFNLTLDLMWLRDHCRRQLCYDSINSNRRVNVLDIPDDISTKSYNVSDGRLVGLQQLVAAHAVLIDFLFVFASQGWMVTGWNTNWIS